MVIYMERETKKSNDLFCRTEPEGKLRNRVQLTELQVATKYFRVGEAPYLRKAKGGRGQIWCRFPFEKRENKYKSAFQRQEGSELAWGEACGVLYLLLSLWEDLEEDISTSNARTRT